MQQPYTCIRIYSTPGIPLSFWLDTAQQMGHGYSNTRSLGT